MVKIKPMRDEEQHYRLLHRWLNTPQVWEWYGAQDGACPPSLDAVKRKYAPRCRGGGIRPCLIELDGIPVGYLQYYPNPDFPAESGVYGIDLLIGETGFRSRGVGTAALMLLAQQLFLQEQVQALTVDPDCANKRAIRCYEKAGFQFVHLIEHTNQQLMVFKKTLNSGCVNLPF